MFFLIGCKEYEYKGKEVKEIFLMSVDYNGGAKDESKIDFTSGEVLSRYYMGADETKPEFKIIHTFSLEDIPAFMNAIGKAGLFKIKEKYSQKGIIDGGGWHLQIVFEDGSCQESVGDNDGPTSIFYKVDLACYELFGDDFFSTLPSTYKYPPSAPDLTYVSKKDNITYNYGINNAILTNYTWRKQKVEGIDNIATALAHKSDFFDCSLAYKLHIGTQNMEYKFKNLKLYSYDINKEDEQLIIDTKYFKKGYKECNILFDRIYVIIVVYEYGTCEYCFSTVV